MCHFWLKNKWSHQFKTCQSKQSVRRGMIMQSPKLSFMTRYKTIFLLSITKKSFSSKKMPRLLGLKRYEPSWALVRKLRKAMGKRDDRSTLKGMMEIDWGYFKAGASKLAHQHIRVLHKNAEVLFQVSL